EILDNVQDVQHGAVGPCELPTVVKGDGRRFAEIRRDQHVLDANHGSRPPTAFGFRRAGAVPPAPLGILGAKAQIGRVLTRPRPGEISAARRYFSGANRAEIQRIGGFVTPVGGSSSGTGFARSSMWRSRRRRRRVLR